MNRLYLVMLYAALGYGSICADRVDDGTIISDNVQLRGDERIIHFTDRRGEGYAAISTHPIAPELLKITLAPTNNVYDLRKLQHAQHQQIIKSLPFYTRHAGKLGMAAGATAAAGAALVLYGFMDGFMDSCRW